MRCRRVRSYLSAYSNDELVDRDRLAVSEHLSTCSACRKEAAIYKSIIESRPEANELKVSDDFNVKLLNRIAQERFAETRTKAHLPRTAPRIVWGRAVPAFVTACLVLLVSVSVFSPRLEEDTDLVDLSSAVLNDDYRTVQPTANPNMTAKLDHSWSLNDQLARLDRVSNISDRITQMSGYDWDVYSSGMKLTASYAGQRVPYVADYFRVRPVVRVYGVPEAASVKEVTRVY
ncbi:MAG: zf-HC2 domain-containing protein [Candidatus Zixiibacteriota bacterium]|nr:MAG: zf-HC2 domain-containing protein [candidate division Zixibacteria bacterium]